MKSYAPAVVRIGLCLVFFWFGFNQLMNPARWVGQLPEWSSLLPLGPQKLVILHGSLEILLASLLLIGLFTRVASFVLSIQLLSIAFGFGLSPSGVRDFGLFFALVAVFLHGPDRLCLDKKPLNRKRVAALVIIIGLLLLVNLVYFVPVNTAAAAPQGGMQQASQMQPAGTGGQQNTASSAGIIGNSTGPA